jgi:hypothetical protein
MQNLTRADKRQNARGNSLRLLLPITLLVLCITAAPLALQNKTSTVTKTIEPSKDVTLVQSTAGDTGNSRGPIFVGRTGQPEKNPAQPEVSIRRGLLVFDVAGSIPAGSKIAAVKLALNMYLTPSATLSARLRLHRLQQDWGEADTVAGGVGTTAAKDEATWIYSFSNTRKWAHPGGDYFATASAVQSVSAPGSYTWDTTPRLVADVQSWLDSPKRNFGWILIGDEAQGRSAKVFSSREDPDPEKRPHLIVTFRPK